MNSAVLICKPASSSTTQTGPVQTEPLHTNTMKTCCLEASPHRIARPEHPREGAFRSALALRYQVYCVECNFLRSDNYPGRAESDEHDEAAQHFYAFDSQDELVGYVRLVPPDAEQRFPFQNHCRTFSDGAPLPVPGRSGEISRLMLRGDYRRVPDPCGMPDDGLAGLASGRPRAWRAGDRRDGAAQVLLSLYRQVYVYSRAHGIDHWYAAMERPLARSLLRMSIAFREIGPQTDYYGPVAPYLANLHEVESHVSKRNPTLLAWLQQPARQAESAAECYLI